MTISPELQRLYASAPAGETILETLELRHPRFAQSWFITNAALPFTARLETGQTIEFITLPFSAKLPGANPGGQQDLVLVIDNVDREIIAELERAAADPTNRISVIYRNYASGDLSAPGSDPIALSISDVAASATRVEATASRTDVLNRRFPSVLYETGLFPGLDR
jgi:Domain of unknown function (DUF1833)